MLNENLYIAVDLGAGSGRVFLADFGKSGFQLEELHRFSYAPEEENDHLRWDFGKIFSEIKVGLKSAGQRAFELNREIESLGVDSWAVDYGLLDEAGNLLANPICYRDERTVGAMEAVFPKISRHRIFEKTGIQFLNFNTIFQLCSENGDLKKAQKMLLMPDLVNYFLTGEAVTEYTNATTTQLLNARTKNWDAEILEKLDLPVRLLQKIIPAGTSLGFLKPEIAKELKLDKVRVIAPATHDTASAVAGAPLRENQAYISSGTWSLVGIEQNEPLINEQVAAQNFTNEGGAFGNIRFLKNVMGLWIFESCRREWQEMNLPVDYRTLLAEAGRIEEFCGFIYPDDEKFLNPPQMLNAIRDQFRLTGQNFDERPPRVTKIILDSLAFRYASILETIENLTGRKLDTIQIVGGGGRNDYLNQMTADASRRIVKAGLIEATVTGNCLVQAISAGRFADLNEARNYIDENIELKIFQPQQSEKIRAAKLEYHRIERMFTGASAGAPV